MSFCVFLPLVYKERCN